MSDPNPEKTPKESSLFEMASQIVAAYVSNNAVPAADLPVLIQDIYLNVAKIASGASEQTAPAPQEAAVPVRKSITNDFIICLEDGKKFKSLKRHLMSAYGMTPAEYRTKWALPRDYPMVAPAYSSVRSSLAREAGLGQKLVENVVEQLIAGTTEEPAGEVVEEPVAEVAENAVVDVTNDPSGEATKDAPVEAAVESPSLNAKKSATVAAKNSADAAARKSTAKKGPPKKAVPKKAVTKKPAAKNAAKRPAAKKAATKKPAAKKATPNKATAKPARKTAKKAG